ncbi:hypothetical protein, variant [Exophiala sideris]|nr:hypothetical protein, variant [Exophiala sideris]
MPARYCWSCDKWFQRSPPVKKCPSCRGVTEAQDRLSLAHIEPGRHVPRSIDQKTSVPPYCLRHHTFGHWEGEGCTQPGAKTIFVVPSLKLHWKIPDEVVANLTSRPIPITKLEAMAHLQKLNEWTSMAYSIVVARDDILRKIRAVLAQKPDDALIKAWHDVMAQTAYGTRIFLCELLSLLHHARNRLLEFPTSDEMAVRRKWRHIAYSHFAVADYLERTPERGSKRINRDEFNTFLRRLDAFADHHLANRDLMVADVEVTAKKSMDAAASFAVKELFQFSVHAMPRALPPILRPAKGVHILVWPDMNHLQRQVQLVMQSVKYTSWRSHRIFL